MKQKDYSEMDVADVVKEIQNVIYDMSSFCQVAQHGLKDQADERQPDVWSYVTLMEHVYNTLIETTEIVRSIEVRVELYERVGKRVLDEVQTSVFFPIDLGKDLQPHIDRARQRGWKGWKKENEPDRGALRNEARRATVGVG